MMIISLKRIFLILLLMALMPAGLMAQARNKILNTNRLQHYVNYFNSIDQESVKNYIPNAKAVHWLEENIPLLECPDSVLEEIYYYRWWTFRKHLKETPDGFVFTEFITPVGHAGQYNTISCALGHHIYEGRWLHNPEFIDQYINFWFQVDWNAETSYFHKFSGWAEDAVYSRFLVNQDTAFVLSLLKPMEQDYQAWVEERGLENHLFWQYDVRDGMEESISGSRTEKNARPTISSYMYANAKALAAIEELTGKKELADQYATEAEKIKQSVQNRLWNGNEAFFEVMHENGEFSNVREEIGFIPWYFGLPDDQPSFGKAWNQLVDPQSFLAPFGITTAEMRDPAFRTHGVGSCEWDGAIWPFATTQTLKGLANLLTNYQHHSLTKEDYFKALKTYAMAHQKNEKPYIGEYQDEQTGAWLKGDNPRSIYYNHSGFCDLIINDLVGLKPQSDQTIKVQPLIPEGEWSWFCLDQIKYHNQMITILWDETGKKYGKGKGFRIFADGKEIFHSKALMEAITTLPKKSDN